MIGADSAATLGGARVQTIEQTTEKLDIVAGQVIVAGTGFVGLGQRFRDIVEQFWSRGAAGQERALDLVKLISASTLKDFSQTFAPQGMYGAFLAFACRDEPFLCEFDLEHFQPELKEKRLWYESMGSAKPITDPFLALMRKAFWRDGPPLVVDAVFAVNWALQHAIEVNPGGVNGPVRIAVLEKHGDQFEASLLSDEELDEHRQNVEAAYDALRRFRERQTARDGVPEIPKLRTD